MEVAEKEVMDGLFQGRITIQKAAEILNASEETIHKMIDEYEYVPTPEDILEAHRIIQENLEYIEKEVFVSYKRSVPPKVRLTDATEILEKVSEIGKGSPAIDATGQIKSGFITPENANPHHHLIDEPPYHW